MWVVNNEKERVKLFLKNDIESNITNISDISNRIHDLIVMLDSAASGTVTGIDRQLIEQCQKAVTELSDVMKKIYACKNLADRLDTKEWIDDD